MCLMVPNGRTIPPSQESEDPTKDGGGAPQGKSALHSLPHCRLFSSPLLSLPSSESVSRFSLFLPRSLCLCLGIYFSIPLYLLFPSVSQNLLSAPSPVSTALSVSVSSIPSHLSLSPSSGLCALTQLCPCISLHLLSSALCPLPCPHFQLLVLTFSPTIFLGPLRHCRRGK